MKKINHIKVIYNNTDVPSQTPLIDKGLEEEEVCVV